MYCMHAADRHLAGYRTQLRRVTGHRRQLVCRTPIVTRKISRLKLSRSPTISHATMELS